MTWADSRASRLRCLPEEPALRLLLRHPSRHAALDPSHADHEHARAIARMLGRLPLALELAGAYLGKYSGDVSLEDYREGLRSDGALATLDADAADLTEADLRRVHDPAVAATIGEQWNAVAGRVGPAAPSGREPVLGIDRQCRSHVSAFWRASATRQGRAGARHCAVPLSAWTMHAWSSGWRVTRSGCTP